MRQLRKHTDSGHADPKSPVFWVLHVHLSSSPETFLQKAIWEMGNTVVCLIFFFVHRKRSQYVIHNLYSFYVNISSCLPIEIQAAEHF